MNADALLRQVEEQPRFSIEVRLLLDSGAFAEARALNDRLEQLRLDPNAGADGDITEGGISEVAQRLVQIYKDTSEHTFTLEARTAAEWEALANAHEAGEFTYALFAACCTEPDGWTVESARRLHGTLTIGQWAVLTTALRQVNEGLFDLRPTRAATALTRGTRQKSTTVQSEEYDDPSS